MSIENWLRLAYAANILILAPVLLALLPGPAGRVFGPETPDVPSLRLLVAALWFAILACSAAGLVWPRAMVAILLLQVIYKSLWLVVFVWPAWRSGQPVPWGPALSFLPIVLLWPWLIVAAWTR